jgi:hypothetical protein
MTTIQTYVQQMLDRQLVIAKKYGSDISRIEQQIRVQNLAELTLLATVIKTLTDKGLISDAELLATLNTARDDIYEKQPIEPPEV